MILDFLSHLMLSLVSLQLSRSGKKSVEAAFEVPHKLKINESRYKVTCIDRAWFWVVFGVDSEKEEGETLVNREFVFVVFSITESSGVSVFFWSRTNNCGDDLFPAFRCLYAHNQLKPSLTATLVMCWKFCRHPGIF